MIEGYDFPEEDEDELDECCLLALETSESHYHCPACDGVVGMMGHYDPETRAYSCWHQ